VASVVRVRWHGSASTLRFAPEWPLAVVAALAWACLLLSPGGDGGGPAAGHEHHDHAHVSVAGALGGWTLMAVAMMLPVTLPAVRHVALNSIRRRRQRAMALYAAVYVGVWVAFGLAATAGYALLLTVFAIDQRAWLVVALATAAAWQLTRTKRRAVLACKTTVPLPPVGWRADRGCVRFAVVQATRCLRSCWALMAVMVIVGHASVAWMAVLGAVVAVEELTVVGRRLLAPFGAALAVAALVAVAA
jgi:predicted metal-binding membrane protein